MNQKFPASEKLKSSKTIQALFEEGKAYTKYPVKMIFIEQQDINFTQAAFAVPKRSFKLAVTRNRIKRQMREAYRLEKTQLLSENGKHFALLFLIIGKDKPQYARLRSSIKALLKTFKDESS